MFIADLLLALFVALVLSAVFALAFRGEGPWTGLMVALAVAFLGAWADGVWSAPLGPSLWGGYWMPFLIVGLIVAFLLTAALSNRRPPREAEGEVEVEVRKDSSTALGLIFWILLMVVGITLAVGRT